ncbi:hypothetical protein N7281_04875 [Rickettsia hoogstraalii]|uniref:hypothetical protein n=1 Tax=Rickettsia hoogstraalii TaxID=467174 RepID=UPI002254009B|nr:hypothetical protein [Rickettsia hoogstraalii]MCX4084176.1 hypothetical protein [Rickettsia hoogstraalii]
MAKARKAITVTKKIYRQTQKYYKAALSCFQSSIKDYPNNYIAYYFSGITLSLLGRYAEAVKMFDYSLRYNKEESTALVHTLSEMLSITEGIRLATGHSNSRCNSDV